MNVHLGLLALLLVLAFALGFLFRAFGIKKIRDQVFDLERDKMQDHAEILQLQKLLSEKQERASAPASTPVVPLKENGQPENGKNKRASQ